MRQLVVSEWVTLDGVFDADTRNQWFEPYDSVERQAFITDMVLAAGASSWDGAFDPISQTPFGRWSRRTLAFARNQAGRHRRYARLVAVTTRGGRRWWAHLVFNRMNIAPAILKNRAAEGARVVRLQ